MAGQAQLETLIEFDKWIKGINDENVETLFKKKYNRYKPQLGQYDVKFISYSFDTTFGSSATIKIDRTSEFDIIGGMFLYFRLPFVPNQETIDSLRVYKAWCNKIGFALVESISLKFQTREIETLRDDIMYILYTISSSKDIDDVMLADITDIEFAETIVALDIYVPLCFCSDRINLGIDLRIQEEVSLVLNTRNILDLLVIGPTHFFTVDNPFGFIAFVQGEYIEQAGTGALGRFLYFDSGFVYYIKANSNVLLSSGTNLVFGLTSNFFVLPTSNESIIEIDVSFINNLELLECKLIAEVIKERSDLQTSGAVWTNPVDPLYLLYEKVIFAGEVLNSISEKSLSLNISDPCKYLIWYCILSDNIFLKNRYNFTDSIIPGIGNNLIFRNSILVDQNSTNISINEYYDQLAKLEMFEKPLKGVNIYSFNLYQKLVNPNGWLNFDGITNKKINIVTLDGVSIRLRAYGIVYVRI